MAHFKGRLSAKTIERDYPHIVEIAVPPGGLGKRLDAMHAFHAERCIRHRAGRGRREGEQDFIQWCFADAATADAFVSAFGGTVIIPPVPKRDPLALVAWGKRHIQS